MQLAYVTGSSYSGSTLLSLLLNAHPGMATIGELEGWRFSERDDFPCSCGVDIRSCPFFREIAAAFRRQGLTFELNDFGTEFRLCSRDRVNRLLLGPLPVGEKAWIERLRDAVVWNLPGAAHRLNSQARANRLFIRTALEHLGATTFVDSSKKPYRLYHLDRAVGGDVRVIHLVRDVRGVSASRKRKAGVPVAEGARHWLQEQRTIRRIIRNGPWPSMTVAYEDLCTSTDETLAGISGFLGHDTPAQWPSFRSVEHHVLGNFMRLEDSSEIRLDQRWQNELGTAERKRIHDVIAPEADRTRDNELERIIRRYMETPA